jgi:hypothetical protein
MAAPTAVAAEEASIRMKKIGESVVDPAALVYEKSAWGTCPNGKAFQQDGIASHDGRQYITWWDGQRRLCIGRRKMPYGVWEAIHFDDYRHKATDTHNVTVLGICPKNGTIHLAFDHHVHPLHYRVSEEGAATEAVKWTAELFGPVTSKLNANGKPLGQVTYPRFLISPEGKLQKH